MAAGQPIFTTAGGCPPLVIPRKDWVNRFARIQGITPELTAEMLRDEIANYNAIEEWANKQMTCGGQGLRFATRVIAASNSLDHNPKHYDAITTGTNSTSSPDCAIIQAQINAVSARGGGLVLLMEGTYWITTTITIPQNVAFCGMGRGTVLKVVDSQTGLPVTTGVIQGPTLAGSVGLSVARLLIDGNRAHNSGGYCGIVYVNCDDSEIVDIWVQNTPAEGIQVSHNSGQITRVVGCSVINCGTNPLGGAARASIFAAGNGVTLSACTVNITDAASTTPGINVAEGAVAVGCVVIGTGPTTSNCTGINIGGAGAAQNPGGTAANCFIEGCSTGIQFTTDSDGGSAIGNRIESCGTGAGIYDTGRRSKISNNTIINTQGHGIYVNGSVTSDDVQVTDNYVIGSSQSAASTYSGIACVSGSYGMYQGNTVRAGSATPLCGIRIYNAGAQNNVVINNDLHTSGGTSFSDAGTGTLTNLDGSANNWNRL